MTRIQKQLTALGLLGSLLLFGGLGLASPQHVDRLRGFRIEVPAGWSQSEREDPVHGHITTLTPADSYGSWAVTIAVRSAGQQDLEGLVAEKLQLLGTRSGEGGDIAAIESFDAELAGRPARGLTFELSSGGVTYRLRQVLGVDQGQLFTVQRHAPTEVFEAADQLLAPVAASFAFEPRDPAALEAAALETQLRDLAQRAGDELDWAADWSAAKDRAQADGRPVLVVAWFLESFALSSTPRTTTFMDQDVIQLVNSRFVPLWVSDPAALTLTRRDGSAYTLGPHTFGQALLVVDPSGVVLAETHAASSPIVAFPFLCQVLGAAPQEPEGAPSVARLERLIDRGELGAAGAEVLALSDAGLEPGLALARQQARLLRLERKLDQARALLDLAVARSEPAPERMLARLELIELELAIGDLEAARATLDALPESDLTAELRARVELNRGALELLAGRPEASRAALLAAVGEGPDSRWASLAAVALGSELFSLGIRPDVGPPDEAALAELLQPFERAVLRASEAPRAAEGALAWLLDAQREDGSFPDPAALSYPESMGANPFVDATAALAGRALLAASGTQLARATEARAAAERTLAFVERSIDSRSERPPLVLFMDYMTWSDAVMLELLVDGLEAGLRSHEALLPRVDALVADLASRQQENGGWSYYKKNDLSAEDVPAQSISFTTAGVSLALSHARAAGFDVPEELSGGGTRALAALRDAKGVFAYFLYGAGVEPHAPIDDPRGEVGRGPACELALYRAGASTPERLAESLELFLEHAPLFRAQEGKALMHAGPQGQGCHYLYFDYLHAALAAECLPEDARTRTRILDLVLDGRQVDGSFMDTPLIGRGAGTAMALRALLALERGALPSRAED